jgi:hypothetical protein
MHHRKRNSIGLFVLSLVLFMVQAGLWVHSSAPAHTETDKQNMEGNHPPTEIPGLVGMFLLVAAAAVASIPMRVTTHNSHT